ncbi:ATP-binding protein, partial [bacterium]|nr:ATP-binding protein [bacterium]
VIIDEVQRVPDLLSYIQEIVDNNQMKGEFILTGSSQFELSRAISQSLAGRTALIKLFPFSYSEIYNSVEFSTEWVNQILYKGFYPRIHSDALNPTDALSAYIETYIERDVRQLYDVKDLNLFRVFIKLLASRVGQLLNYSSIANDCGISLPTVKQWISILEQSYIIFILHPFHRNMKKRLIKTPKIYFYDVALVAYLTGAKQSEHVGILPVRGSLFENFIVAEMVKMSAHNNMKHDFYFFRDKEGKEVDLLIDKGLSMLPLEIKSAQTFIMRFVENLKYFAELSRSLNIGSVIYAGESQKRSDFTVYNYYDFFKSYLLDEIS